jgi:hypothetical protein
MNVELNFINRSENGHQCEVLFFQRNAINDLGETVIAWKRIRFCGRDCNHPFVLSTHFEINCSDSFGNHGPRLAAEAGNRFVRVSNHGRSMLQYGTRSPSSRDIQVKNAAERGAVNVNLFSSGRLLARKSSVVPGQKAIFEFDPVLWVGVAAEVDEGGAIESAILNDTNQKLFLHGVRRADIVMTGGGGGTHARPYEFSLERVVPGSSE